MAYPTAKGKAPKPVTIAVAAAFAVLVGAANVAQAQGGYLGASIGQTDYDGVSDNPTGVKIFGGYNFNKNLGVEVTWYDFGDADVSGGSVKVDGIGAAAVGILPLSQTAALFGKVGMVMWDADFPGGSDDGTDLVYGIGVKWDLNRQFALRVEYENADIADGDATLLSVGFSYQF